MAAFVKFWGTRGSIPTPASWTRVYGGNTPCVEIRFDQTIFICDAGSGIRELGKDMLTRNPPPNTLHLLITHTHWDHIQGFPFFAPVYGDAARIHVYGRQGNDNLTYRVVSRANEFELFSCVVQGTWQECGGGSFERRRKGDRRCASAKFPAESYR